MYRHDASARVTIPAALGLLAMAWCAACAPSAEHRAGGTLPPQAVSSGAAEAPQRIAMPQIGAFEVSGPFTHGNLALYLIRGADRLAPDADVVTLHTALGRGEAAVLESGAVWTVRAVNRSERQVLALAGDLLAGGNQDRVVAEDLVLEPGVGPTALQSFCVEHGRWRGRLGASKWAFAGSSRVAAGAELREAIRVTAVQQVVWDGVASLQQGLSEAGFRDARSAEFPTSLERSLQGRDLERAISPYRAALAGVVRDKPDAVGCAFAVGGRLEGAQIYAAAALFREIWPALLDAAATAAIAVGRTPAPASAPACRDVAAELTESTDAVYRTRMTAQRMMRQEARWDDKLRIDTWHARLGWLRSEVLFVED